MALADRSPKLNFKDVGVVRDKDVTQIMLPGGMSIDEGMIWLKRQKDEEERTVGVSHELNYSPLDGAVAFHKAISQIYGFSSLVPTPGFFGDTPPTMVGVQVSPTETVQVPWGRVEIPGIEGFLTTGIKWEPNPCFVINGQVKRKSEGKVHDLVDVTRKILQENSIYKGKSIKVSFEWKRNDEDFDPMADCPQFIELSGVDEDDLIFSDTVQSKLNIALFHPIRYPEACRAAKIPLKRGILLSGRYGVGKTLTANVTAKRANSKGWTFIYLESVLDLKEGLQFAAQYSPAVIFAEDIDRMLQGERTYDMDDVLNILDGVDTKGREIISVFTTNHIDDINHAVRRPGRLDAIVDIPPPDADAAVKIIRRYSKGLLVDNIDLTKVGEVCNGQIPAIIRETVERAKIAAIGRTNGGNIQGQVTESDLLEAALAMAEHAKLLEVSQDVKDDTARVFMEVTGTRNAQKVLSDIGMKSKVLT